MNSDVLQKCLELSENNMDDMLDYGLFGADLKIIAYN